MSSATVWPAPTVTLAPWRRSAANAVVGSQTSTPAVHNNANTERRVSERMRAIADPLLMAASSAPILARYPTATLPTGVYAAGGRGSAAIPVGAAPSDQSLAIVTRL